MRVAYHLEPIVDDPVMYFAGPTYFPDNSGWHSPGIMFLTRQHFSGTVAVPMPRNGVWHGDTKRQFEWQVSAQSRAKVIVFWVPRPGIVTCIEFGHWMRSGKVVLGVPPRAPKTEALFFYARAAGVPIESSLIETLDRAMTMC